MDLALYYQGEDVAGADHMARLGDTLTIEAGAALLNDGLGEAAAFGEAQIPDEFVDADGERFSHASVTQSRNPPSDSPELVEGRPSLLHHVLRQAQDLRF